MGSLKKAAGRFSLRQLLRVRPQSDERGNAVVEFALVMPFLAFLTTAVIDVGFLLNEYLLLTEAVHQGARMASGTLQFRTEAAFTGLTNGQLGCPGTQVARVPALPTETEKHRDVQERVESIVNLQTTSLDPTSLCIRSELMEDGGKKDVLVRVTARYSSFFPLFDDMQINVQATAPFLQG